MKIALQLTLAILGFILITIGLIVAFRVLTMNDNDLLQMLMTKGNRTKRNPVTNPVKSSLVPGQKYKLKATNSYDPKATVRLVAVPGVLAAYDDTEEAGSHTPCQHIPQGTSVSVLEIQDTYGAKNAFVKVQMEEGVCKGKNGWALAMDVQ